MPQGLIICEELPQRAYLEELIAQARVIVELGNDWPADAFAAICRGAFNVVALGTDASDIWDVVRTATTGSSAYPLLLKKDLLPPEVPAENWGFMSMSYSPQDPSTNDYLFAIEPTVRYLGLDLARVDQTPPASGNNDLRARLCEEINRRKVLIAQISSSTPNTMYEIGYADAKNKDILWLRHKRRELQPLDAGVSSRENRPWTEVPAVLQGFIRLHYATRTELAMRLFFGLGGTHESLRSSMSPSR